MLRLALGIKFIITTQILTMKTFLLLTSYSSFYEYYFSFTVRLIFVGTTDGRCCRSCNARLAVNLCLDIL